MTVTSLSSESQKATPHPVTTVSRERAHPKTRTLGERGLARRVSPKRQAQHRTFQTCTFYAPRHGSRGRPRGKRGHLRACPRGRQQGVQERLAPRSRAARSRREGRRARAGNPLFARSAIVPRRSRVSRSLGRGSRSRTAGTWGCRARNPGTRTSHVSERRGSPSPWSALPHRGSSGRMRAQPCGEALWAWGLDAN